MEEHERRPRSAAGNRCRMRPWGRGDWIRWMVTLGLAPVAVAALGAAYSEPDFVGILIQLFEWVIVIGITEAILLRGFLPRFSILSWVILSMLGAALALAVGFAATLVMISITAPLSDSAESTFLAHVFAALGFVPAAFLGGAVVGGLQGMVLPKDLRGRRLWILACGIGAVFWFIPILVAGSWMVPSGTSLAAAAGPLTILVGTLLYALVTGWTISSILRASAVSIENE
jgi:hypothetical protein